MDTLTILIFQMKELMYRQHLIKVTRLICRETLITPRQSGSGIHSDHCIILLCSSQNASHRPDASPSLSKSPVIQNSLLSNNAIFFLSFFFLFKPEHVFLFATLNISQIHWPLHCHYHGSTFCFLCFLPSLF